MLKKEARLSSNYEFNKTRRLGASYTGEFSKIFYLKLKNTVENTRVGIVVTNKFSSSAVKRNRIKRVYREIIRKIYSDMSAGYWIVVYPRHGFQEASYEEVSSDLTSLLQKISILK